MSDDVKVLTLDIETSPNLADVWGLWDQNVGLNQLKQATRVICWAAKWRGRRPVEFRSEYHDGREEMVRRIHELVDQAQVVVGYNHHRFDMPHLRREWLQAGLTPPSPWLEVDLMRVAKSQFKFSSNKLEFVSRAVGLSGKLQHTGHTLWRECLDPEVDEAVRRRAWGLMRRYNVQDVRLTEELYEVLRPWAPSHPHLGLLGGVEGDSCSRCGGTHLQKRGFKATGLSVYQQFQCCTCGAWSRGKQRVDSVNVRGIQ